MGREILVTPAASELHGAVEAYIKAADARARPDVVYLNTPD